jgi:urease accessory protein
MRRLCGHVTCTVASALVFFPAHIPQAHAHLVSTGLGPFYDGVAHVLVTPEDAVAVLALALLSGMSGISSARAVLFTLPTAWCLGALFGQHTPPPQSVTWLTVTTFIAIGALIAMNCRLTASAAICLSIVIGFPHGYFDGPERTGVLSDFSMLSGTLACMFFAIAVISATVASLHAAWTRMVMRTIGSWIAAAGLLLLAWLLKQSGLA